MNWLLVAEILAKESSKAYDRMHGRTVLTLDRTATIQPKHLKLPLCATTMKSDDW
jgi:hypothetical protein